MPESAVGSRVCPWSMNKTDCLKLATWMEKIVIQNKFCEERLSSQEGRLRKRQRECFGEIKGACSEAVRPGCVMKMPVVGLPSRRQIQQSRRCKGAGKRENPATEASTCLEPAVAGTEKESQAGTHREIVMKGMARGVFPFLLDRPVHMQHGRMER